MNDHAPDGASVLTRLSYSRRLDDVGEDREHGRQDVEVADVVDAVGIRAPRCGRFRTGHQHDHVARFCIGNPVTVAVSVGELPGQTRTATRKPRSASMA
ncbi:hypothetical protein E1293_29085 [Actinomadura darangshiensis]|uniref:Uncharacterized protein n=1 Tax=Actinomadura darangshiensis TaxID=705336 RepID=A0A4R5ASX2_9ACTN|nr:hypothetical protein [Actinomadura darangshiensis]TDD74786.1 hypothetical protein E1293_29085 [Actinomadura darangshiensis]